MMRALRLTLLLAAVAAASHAVDWKALRPEGYVSDFAGVVSPPIKTQLEIYCAVVEQSTGVQIALVTVPSLEGEPVEDVANAIFRGWGVGKKGKDEGVMLLLAVGERRSKLEVGYGLEPILTDGSMGGLLRQMAPALREQRYGEAMMGAAETIGQTVADAKHVTLSARLPRRSRPSPVSSIPWPLVIGGVFLLSSLLRRGGGYGSGYSGMGGLLPGLILGGLLNRGTWGGRGSGGFGGFDSGDGFGGFGGGDSGGGGASGDW